MADNTRPDDFDEIIDAELMTLKEAKEYSIEKLRINEKYFRKFIRPKLNPKPVLVDSNNPKPRSLKVRKSDLEQVIYDIKKMHAERTKVKNGVFNG